MRSAAPDLAMIAPLLDRDGFAIAPSGLASKALDDVTSAIEDALRDVDAAGERGSHALRDLLVRVPEARHLAEGPALRGVAEAVLGPGAFVVRGLLFDKTEAANWKVAWHQDLTIEVEARADAPGFGPWSVKTGVPHVQPPVAILERMLTVRLHLDPCTSENGALRVIPGSHAMGRLSPEEIAALASSRAPVLCEAPAGGLLVMRPLLVHASSSASRPGRRRVLHLDFAREALPAPLRWRTGAPAAIASLAIDADARAV